MNDIWKTVKRQGVALDMLIILKHTAVYCKRQGVSHQLKHYLYFELNPYYQHAATVYLTNLSIDSEGILEKTPNN